MIKLVISDNEGTTTVVPLVRDEVSIGRKDGNTIRLTERNISREHCRLQRMNGSYVIRDLGSYNGVLLNGQRVAGESQVKPGDELRIGDYTLLLQTEGAEKTVEPDAPTTLAPLPKQPARLVVLTAPLEGAEFTLPERGEVRIGRAPELDVSIDHRSVSREHAKLACDGSEIRIVDRASVNGVVVNREKITEARLAAGDVIELGDVLLRFVGAGEQYVFDPAEARALAGHKRAKSRRPWPLAGAIAVAALIAAYLIVRDAPKPDETAAVTPEPAQPKPAQAADPAPPSAAGALAAAAAVEPDHFPDLLKSCLDANAGGRFAEAVAHATGALKLRPDAQDAIACEQIARANHEQEQIYVRGKAALEGHDVDGAFKELSTLSPTSAVRQRPEVSETVQALAKARLAQAAQVARKHPEEAAERATEVLTLEPLSDATRDQAQALLAKLEAARPATHPARPEPVATARRPSESKPAARAAASDKPPPMEAATACLARGDNPCVIRALNGKAQSAQELGLLIETYRAMGDSPQAYRNMATYVQRFPTARRAETYRQMLERRSE